MRRGDLEAFRPLRAVWIGQVALASGLVFALDSYGFSLGLRNPMGCMVAIMFAVSLGGAASFTLWRMMGQRG